MGMFRFSGNGRVMWSSKTMPASTADLVIQLSKLLQDYPTDLIHVENDPLFDVKNKRYEVYFTVKKEHGSWI
ncbi:hypothetical protein [Paucilactobacillus nenjiangensis]|jgi:hypothetical protein|uniref:hypothetical protein n=2 Tax=Paucilactobacillus nenjiangensis TaxID=1296540 RepID=UPI0028D5C87C|nr:hypothetical protein [Paucilactobacillus nenjiangensis]